MVALLSFFLALGVGRRERLLLEGLGLGSGVPAASQVQLNVIDSMLMKSVGKLGGKRG